MSRVALWSFCWLCAACQGWHRDEPSGAAASATLSVAQQPSASPPSPTILLEVEESAYGATLSFDDDALFLLTATHLHRFAPGTQPQRRALDLGVGAAFTSDSVLFWSRGTLWAVPKEGGRARALGKLPSRPQRIVSSRERFAWLSRDGAGKFEIQTMRGDRTLGLYTAVGYVSAIEMLEDSVFFVESAADSSWRVGRVSVDGGTALFTSQRAGRTPAMLARSAAGVFYYDGPSRSVRRLSGDFARDEVMAEKVVCSPLAVATRLFCARVGGLFEVPLDGGSERRLAPTRVGPIAALAANETHVAWVSDSGKSRLTLQVLPFVAGAVDEFAAGSTGP